MHILATFATLCCQTRWPRNHSCTTQEHVSFFRTFSGTRQKPTGQNRTFSEISTFSRFCRFCSKSENSVENMCTKKFTCVRLCEKNIYMFRTFSQMCRTQIHKCANVQMCKSQMCKCAKNRRAQNAQICSANYFPNAEITNLHCAQIHKCKFHTCTISFLCACKNYFNLRV